MPPIFTPDSGKPLGPPPGGAYYPQGTVTVRENGEPVEREVLQCATCGVFVLDRLEHDLWHRSQPLAR